MKKVFHIISCGIEEEGHYIIFAKNKEKAIKKFKKQYPIEIFHSIEEINPESTNVYVVQESDY